MCRSKASEKKFTNTSRIAICFRQTIFNNKNKKVITCSSPLCGHLYFTGISQANGTEEILAMTSRQVPIDTQIGDESDTSTLGDIKVSLGIGFWSTYTEAQVFVFCREIVSLWSYVSVQLSTTAVLLCADAPHRNVSGSKALFCQFQRFQNRVESHASAEVSLDVHSYRESC